MQNVTEVIDALKVQYKMKTDAELAELLDVSTATLSAWKKRNSIGTLMEKILDKNIIQMESIVKTIEQSNNRGTTVGINLGSAISVDQSQDEKEDELLTAIKGSLPFAKTTGKEEEFRSCIYSCIRSLYGN